MIESYSSPKFYAGKDLCDGKNGWQQQQRVQVWEDGSVIILQLLSASFVLLLRDSSGSA